MVSIDPRLKVPDTFNDFVQMLHLFMIDLNVKAEEKDTILMKFVKSDLSKTVRPGIHRYAVYTGPEKVTPLSSFISNKPTLIYINFDTTKKPYDELLEGSYCISNDMPSAIAMIAKIIHVMELKSEIW